MSLLTTINGIPLYSTLAEALAWGAANNKQGYHTHIYQGQTGYMGGATHGEAASSAQGLNGSNQNTNNNINNNFNSGSGNNNFNSGY
tara:strand:- start:76 stop:336 length:261 start_codon:yes stop_codon:yes gene_type:complete